MMRYLTFIFTFLLINSVNAEVNKPLDEVAIELSKCAAYFAVVSNAIESSGEPELSKSYENLSLSMNSYSLEMSKNGRSNAMAEKVSLSRFQMYLNLMMKEIGEDAANISILMNQYLTKCDLAQSNPAEFAESILDQYSEK